MRGSGGTERQIKPTAGQFHLTETCREAGDPHSFAFREERKCRFESDRADHSETRRRLQDPTVYCRIVAETSFSLFPERMEEPTAS